MTMSIAIAVLKETLAHERRVALVPSVAAKLVKIGARLHLQSGVGAAAQFDDSAYQDVIFSSDRNQLVGQANIILAVQPPTLEVIDAMSAEAILISFIYAEKSPELVQRLLDKKITCFAMERIPRIARAQSMDALSSQAALTGYYAVQLGATQMLKTLPKSRRQPVLSGLPKSWSWASAWLALKRLQRHIAWVRWWKLTMSGQKRRNRHCLAVPALSTPVLMRAAMVAMHVRSTMLKKNRSIAF